MNIMEILAHLQDGYTGCTCQTLKSGIFGSDLRDCEITECIVENAHHNFSLVADAMRLLNKSIQDLYRETMGEIGRYPESYQGQDEELALWHVAEGYVMEVLARDSRVCKRAGW